MPVDATSLIADHIDVAGFVLSCSNTAGSPDVFLPVCNVTDVAIPLSATEILVTNVSDTWVRRVPTLLDMGKVSFSVWWVMTDPSHRNAAGGGAVPTGLRNLFINKYLRRWEAAYPMDGSPADSFGAYLTGFNISGKTGDAWKAACSLGTTGTPALV